MQAALSMAIAAWRGDRRQHVQVFVLKAVPLVERVDFDDAQRLALGVDDRRAKHRADAEFDDALAHVEPFVARGVGRQDRLFRVHDVVNDRAADADMSSQSAAAVADRLRDQRAAGRPHHDAAAVGLDENLEQAVEQLRITARPSRASCSRLWVISNSARSLASGRTASCMPDAADATSSFDVTDESRLTGSSSTITARLDEARPGADTRRRRVEELQRHLANANPVVIGQVFGDLAPTGR